MDILFLYKVPGDRQAYANKLISVSDRLGTEANWIQFLIDWEDAGTFSPSNENSFGCIGYIQFCPDVPGGSYKTIGGIPYEMSEIKAMNPEQQLELVYTYLKPYKGDIESYYDLYFAILWPAALGKEDSYVLRTNTNNVFDINKDGAITVGEVKKYLDNRVKQVVPAEYQDSFKKKEISFKSTREKSSLEPCY